MYKYFMVRVTIVHASNTVQQYLNVRIDPIESINPTFFDNDRYTPAMTISARAITVVNQSEGITSHLRLAPTNSPPAHFSTHHDRSLWLILISH
jgi:hypothetical protein